VTVRRTGAGEAPSASLTGVVVVVSVSTGVGASGGIEVVASGAGVVVSTTGGSAGCASCERAGVKGSAAAARRSAAARASEGDVCFISPLQ
jgi:hypothetical protein